MSETKRTLSLNRKRAIFLGVCSGYADYLRIEPFFIRVAFVIAVFTWLPAILFYFVSFFCMNRDGNSINEIKSTLVNSRMGKHFSNVDYKKRLYKNTANKRIAGVCAGFADYFETSPFFIRLAFLGSLFLGPYPIFAYIAAAILMDKNPDTEPARVHPRRERRVHPQERQPVSRHVNEAINMYAKKRKAERSQSEENAKAFDRANMDDCVNRFSELEKKLRRLEATITSKKFKLHSELNRMSNS